MASAGSVPCSPMTVRVWYPEVVGPASVMTATGSVSWSAAFVYSEYACVKVAAQVYADRTGMCDRRHSAWRGRQDICQC